MGKSKAGKQNAIAKQQLHSIKNGSVNKNKDPKFKNTPIGKVALINKSKAQHKNAPPQKKDIGAKNQNAPKNKAQQLKQNLPKGKQNIPTGMQTVIDKKVNLNPKLQIEEDDSDSDVDEGIVPQEDISLNKSDETFEDEESDSDVPDILGKSLNDDSDEDDEDFEEEEEEEDEDDEDIDMEMVKNKGIKMFKGLKSKPEEDEDDDDNDESDENMVNQLDMESDEDDEDEEDEEDEEDDDDDDDDDEEEDNQTINSSKLNSTSSMEIGEDDDDDEEDEDDEDDDEDEDSAPGLKALLESNITDDDDDEDFNEEDEDDEDDDISDEDDSEENNDVIKDTKEKVKASNSKDIASKQNKKSKEEKKVFSPEEREENDKRTVMVDNVSNKTTENDIKKVFDQFGSIENVRISQQSVKLSKKMAAIKKRLSLHATTSLVFIRYTSQDSAQKALVMNGKQLAGNYMNVMIADRSSRKPRDNKKSVFLGNLKYDLESNAIWKHFAKCGEIENVQILRDKKGVNRGCGYINFKTKEAAMLALKMDGDEVMNRAIRVKPCFSGEKKPQEQGNKRALSNKGQGNPQKKFKNILEKPVARKPENEMKQHKKSTNYASPEEKKSDSFQGQKANIKNKKKGNKPDKKKKEMAKKLMAKSQKPVKV